MARADSTIGGLPNLPGVADDSLLAVESQGEAYHLTGAQWKEYARESVKGYVESAQQSAQNAAQSATQAKDAQTAAEQAKTDAEAAQRAAAQSAAAAAASQQAAAQSAQAAQNARDAAAQSAQNAAAAQTAAQAAQRGAEQARNDAQAAQNAAAQSAQSAANAQTAAQAAQQGAQSAQSAAEAARTEAENAQAEAAKSAETAIQYSGKPPRPINGTWWVWNANTGEYEDTGIKAILSIVKSYGSVEEMEDDLLNMQEGDLVIIAADINIEENAQLYVHTGTNWRYLSDLSGIQGVGISNIVLTEGNHSPGTYDYYTIYLTDGRTFTLPVYNGRDGEGSGDMLAEVYDPQGRKTDVFKYVDDKIKSVGITATDDGEGNVTLVVVGTNVAYNDGNLIIG